MFHCGSRDNGERTFRLEALKASIRNEVRAIVRNQQYKFITTTEAASLVTLRLKAQNFPTSNILRNRSSPFYEGKFLLRST